MAEFPIPFDGGIHQDLDPAVAPEGALARITNGRIPRQGGIVKRFGTTSVSQSVEPSGITQAFGSGRPHAVGFAQGREILAVSGRAYMRDDATSPKWVECGRPAGFLPRRSYFVALDESVTVTSAPQVATVGDTICVVYSEIETPALVGVATEYVVIQLFDKSMVRIFTKKLSVRSKPRVFVCGSTYVVTYADPDATVGAAIYGRTLVASTLTLSAESTIVLKLGTSDSYDAAPLDATHFVLLSRTGAALMRMRIVDLAFATGANQAVACANAQTTVSRIYGTPGEGVWAVWKDTASTALHIFACDAAMAGVTGGPVAFGGVNGVTSAGITRRSSTTVWVVWNDTETWDGFAETSFYCRGYDMAAALVTAGASVGTMFRMTAASTPHDGDTTGFRIWMSTLESNGTSRYYLMRINPDESAGTRNFEMLCPELTSALTSTFANPAPPVAVNGNRRFFACLEQLGNFVNSIQLYDYEDASTRRGAWRQALECCGSAVLAGGHLQGLPADRRNDWLFAATTQPRGFENGFIRSPNIRGMSAVAGGAMTIGTFQAYCVFEYVDLDGRRHQSEPSNLASATTAGANLKIALTVTTPALSERDNSTSQAAPVLALYMTRAGGSTFYRVQAVRVAPYAAHVLFAITSDPNSALEQIYTAGGELQNSPAPSSRFALFSHDALWLCGMWDPRMIERSKTVVPGTPPRFTLANQFRAIAPFDVSALAELDGQILVLGVDGLAVMSAEGPNNQGVPALVAPTFLSPLGLVPGGEVAVIRIPAGVVYPGRRGLYLAPRGGGDPEFLGSPIQGDLKTVYSATEHYEVADDGVTGSRLVAFAITNQSGVNYVAELDQDSLQWVSADVLPNDVELLGNFGSAIVYVPLDSTTNPIRTPTAARDDATDATSLIVETDHCRPFGLLGWGYALSY